MTKPGGEWQKKTIAEPRGSGLFNYASGKRGPWAAMLWLELRKIHATQTCSFGVGLASLNGLTAYQERWAEPQTYDVRSG